MNTTIQEEISFNLSETKSPGLAKTYFLVPQTIRTLTIVILIYLSILTSLTAEEAPFFRLKDQRGVTIDSRSFKGKTLFLLGCNFKDVVLCRKHGRKIYWRMQNLLEEAEDTTVFVAFLDFRGAPKEVFSYIEKERNKNYESIYLDEKGVLSSGVRSGFSWLRIFSRNKRLLYESYYSEVDDRTVDSLYEIIRRQKK